MRSVSVNIQDHYPIYIGNQIMEQLPQLIKRHCHKEPRSCAIITDTNVASLYGKKLNELLDQNGYKVILLTISPGEISKNLKTIEELLSHCLHSGLNRNDIVLGIGGGVVGDIAGFLASVYMRGISYIHLPTTIIAHDSSIGGKVGVNHALGKNLIGSFHHPRFVLYDVSFLKTLPMDERISGYAEILKHGLIYNSDFVAWLEKNGDSLISLDLSVVEEAIYQSCLIKAEVVSEDEKEEEKRKILNYGHTIGHAIEATTAYTKYKHGEAVSIGMRGAAMLSSILFKNKEVLQKTEELLTSFQLPLTLDDEVCNKKLLTVMKKDKKRVLDGYTFVVSPEIGKTKVVQVPEKDVLESLIKLRK